MTRIDSRKLAVAVSALLVAAAPAAHALKPIPIAGYTCKADSQIAGGGVLGLIETIKIAKEITPGAQDCAKACTQTAGCVGINVKEVWENGQEVTYCQLYSKVTGTTPYTLGTDGEASWGFACVNISRVKWKLPNNETYSAQPYLPPVGDPNGASGQDANRPGGAPSFSRKR